jgi:hypothetical protein
LFKLNFDFCWCWLVEPLIWTVGLLSSILADLLCRWEFISQ